MIGLVARAALIATTGMAAASAAQTPVNGATPPPGAPAPARDPDGPAQAVPPAAQTSTAAAQSPSDSLQDIIVTAQRRAENLQDVPASISALQGTALAGSAAFETQDIAKFVPSLTIVSSLGGSQPGFTLRGIGRANQFEAYQVPPIGVYIDEVYQTSPSTHGQQLYDLERVEVLRGPQGTLYGKNTTGGAINYITNRPSLHGERGFLYGGYGNFDTRELQGAVELTPADGTLGIRVAGDWVKSDGWTRNVSPGDNDLNSRDSLSGRIIIRLQPASWLDIQVKGYASRDRDSTPGVFFVGNQPDGSWVFAGGALSYSRAGLKFHEIDEPGPRLAMFRNNTGADLRVGIDLAPDLKLTSVSNVSSGRVSYDQDVDGTPLQILHNRTHARFRQWSSELRLQYTGIEGLDLLVGAFAGKDRVRYAREDQVLFSLPVVSNPAAGVPPIGGNVQFNQRRESYAGFVHGIYEVTDRLKATLGFRFTHDLSIIEDINSYLRLRVAPGGPVVPAVNTVPAFGPYDPTQTNPGLRNTENEPTGTFSLAYALSPDANVYASYSRGYRAGANNAGTLSVAAIQYLEPERVNAYEVGLKTEFLSHRLRVNAAGYYYDYQNLHVQEIVGPQTFLASAGPARIYGVDLEVSAVPTPRLRLNSTLGYLIEAKYTTDGKLVSGSVRDNRLPFAPKVTWRSGFDWDTFDAGDYRLTLHADANYTDSQFFSPLNEDVYPATGIDARGLKQTGYWLVDASATLRIGERLELSAWVKNLTNKDYFAYGLEFRSAAQFATFITGTPRTFGGSARIKF